MTDETRNNPRLPAVAVRLAALWVLVGASFKLFLGTPADLPAVIRDLPLELGLTYKLAISIELLVTVLAFGLPRVGWIPVALLYAVFELVLAQQLAAGETSCGCLGSSVQLSPLQMMAIDTALLVLLLVSRPWRLVRGAPVLVVALLAVLAAGLPWLVDREAKAPPRPTKQAPAGAPTASTSGDASAPQGAAEEADAPAEQPASALKSYLVLSPEEWVGQSVYETPLADWIEVERADESQPPGDISELPIDGAWILWRWDCDHCAEHLEYLANYPPPVPFVTLIRLRQARDTDDNQAVFVLPQGPTVVHAAMPESVDYVTTTPCELVLEGGTITAAREGATLEDSVLPQ